MGKTEVAKALSAWTGGALIRLQCYEGISISQAVYEWDYARQILSLRVAETADSPALQTSDLYSEQFLVRRPLLQAVADNSPVAPVLLIDEIDRADDEFEAFLLEVLSDWTITVPEIGAFTATTATSHSHHIQPHTRYSRCPPPALLISLGGAPRFVSRNSNSLFAFVCQ